jgi:succinate--hydroxymethylglutarate CoA-transferase
VSKDLPLAGVRVLDLTRVLAGPYSTMLLGDLGAEVIKIENPSGGDDTREWGPPFFDPARPGPLTPAVVEYRKRLQNPYDLAALSSPVPAHVTESDPHAANAAPPATSGTAVRGEAAYFLALNRNKRSMAVDLKSTRGKQLILDLATVSDVVVENYIPGKLDALGIGYSALSAVNPNLIFASISGYGATGPMRETAGYDVMASSLGGLLGVTGSPDAPVRRSSHRNSVVIFKNIIFT